MSQKTEVANLAISHLGQGKEIANIDSDRSSEALTMKRYLPIAIQVVLKDFPHSFSNVTSELALVEEQPNDEWAFSYRYPTDCLQMLRILSGVRNDTRQSRVNYKIGKDVAGKLIYTDKEDAVLEYTQNITDTDRFPPDLTLALSFLLASLAAPRLTGEDPFKMGERAMNMYLLYKGKAEVSDANEEQQEEPPEAEAVRARG